MRYGYGAGLAVHQPENAEHSVHVYIYTNIITFNNNRRDGVSLLLLLLLPLCERRESTRRAYTCTLCTYTECARVRTRSASGREINMTANASRQRERPYFIIHTHARVHTSRIYYKRVHERIGAHGQCSGVNND